MSPAFLFIVSFRIEGALWRAVFVAALALAAFALLHYWRRLARATSAVRVALVSLRGLSLLLLASALAGVSMDYDAARRARVVVSWVGEGRTDEAGAAVRAEAGNRLRAALEERKLELVEADALQSEAALSDSAVGVLASLLLVDGALPPAQLQREFKRASSKAGGAPVYALNDFAEQSVPGVALESIALMNRPRRGVPLLLRCLVHARGMRGRSTLLRVADDAQVQSSTEVRWTSDDERQLLTLEAVPKSAGWHTYTARLEASSGDAVSAALSRSVAVHVEEGRVRLLFIEGEPTWEAKFIRRALEETDLFEVEYFAQVSRAAILGQTEQAGEAGEQRSQSGAVAPEARLRAALASATRLNAYACVILGATPDALLSSAEAARLGEWVERRGGGLIILGGNSFNGSIVAPQGKLSGLLPAEIEASSFRTAAQAQAGSAPLEAEKRRGGTPLTPTVAGAGGALSGFVGVSAGLPGMDVLSGEGFKLGALRAGATVLAVNGRPEEDGTSEAGAPLIVSARQGAGRTLLFAPADSWRLQTASKLEDQSQAYAELWQGLSLWTAAGARPQQEIVLSEESPKAGSWVTAEIRVRDEAFLPLKIETTSAHFQRVVEEMEAEGAAEETSEETAAEETSTTKPGAHEISFAPDRSEASIWRARFIAPEAGRFSLEVEYRAGGKTGAAQKYFATVAPAGSVGEANPDALRRLARETGGDLHAGTDFDGLAAKLAALPRREERVPSTRHLRTWWPLALLLPLLLSAEWLIARIKG